MKDIILALDFDGTLYPIIQYDSEQMLALSSIENGNDEKEIRAFIDMDKRGCLLPHEFNSQLESHVKGQESAIVEKVVDRILTYFDPSELDPLRDILENKNVHMALLSCGTDILIESFLRRTGLLKHRKHMLAKEMTVKDGRLDHFIYHVTHIRDKAEKIKELRTLYDDPIVVAVGDGPTDEPMLEEADYPFIIDWRGKIKDSKFPRLFNFFELKIFLKNSFLIK